MSKKSMKDSKEETAGPIHRWGGPLLALLGVFVWIYVIPGWVAIRDHAFNKEQVAQKLTGEARQQWSRYEITKNALSACIQAEDAALAQQPIDQQEIKLALGIRQSCSEASASTVVPLTLAGFVGNWLSEIWLISYLALFILIRQLNSMSEAGTSVVRATLLGLFLYVLQDWSSWLRSFGLRDVGSGRRVYSFVNWDISPTSFVLQELRMLGMMILIGIVMDGSAVAHQKIRRELAVRSEADFCLTGVIRDVMMYRDGLQSWQTFSIMLGVIFLPFGYFYWREIQAHDDARYFPSAVTIQLIWLATWYLATRPLLEISRWWRLRKLTALAEQGTNGDKLQTIIQTVENSSEWQVLGAAIAASASLIVPILRALLH